MGTIAKDVKPKMPAKTVVLQSPTNTACIKRSKAVSKSLTVLTNRLEATCFYNRIT